MHPVPGTITDPGVDKLLYKTAQRPRPTTVELDTDDRRSILGLVPYLRELSQEGSGDLFLLDRDRRLLEKLLAAVS